MRYTAKQIAEITQFPFALLQVRRHVHRCVAKAGADAATPAGVKRFFEIIEDSRRAKTPSPHCHGLARAYLLTV